MSTSATHVRTSPCRTPQLTRSPRLEKVERLTEVPADLLSKHHGGSNGGLSHGPQRPAAPGKSATRAEQARQEGKGALRRLRHALTSVVMTSYTVQWRPSPEPALLWCGFRGSLLSARILVPSQCQILPNQSGPAGWIVVPPSARDSQSMSPPFAGCRLL